MCPQLWYIYICIDIYYEIYIDIIYYVYVPMSCVYAWIVFRFQWNVETKLLNCCLCVFFMLWPNMTYIVLHSKIDPTRTDQYIGNVVWETTCGSHMPHGKNVHWTMKKHSCEIHNEPYRPGDFFFFERSPEIAIAGRTACWDGALKWPKGVIL